MTNLPLSNLETADLDAVLAAAQACETDDSPAMNEVIRRFDPLARRLSQTLTECPYLQDDLANAARVGLVRAVRGHELTRRGFPAYARQFMRGAVLREYKSWMTPAIEVSLDDEPEEAELNTVALDTETIVVEQLAPWGDGILAEAVAALTADQREIAERRYIDDEDLATIAIVTGTTISAVSQRLVTIHKVLELALSA